MDISTSLVLGIIIGLVVAVPFVWIMLKQNKTLPDMDLNEIKAQLSLLITSGNQSQKTFQKLFQILWPIYLIE